MTNATVFGGLTIGNNSGDQDAGDLNNPNIRINNAGDIGFDSPYQIRGGFSYTLPADVRLSGSLRSSSGLPQTAHVRGHDDAGAGPDAGDAERAGGRARRVPLSLGQPARPARREGRSGWAARASSRRADLFNVFNNNAVTNAVQTIGTSLGRPSAIVMGRLLRLGGRVTF